MVSLIHNIGFFFFFAKSMISYQPQFGNFYQNIQMWDQFMLPQTFVIVGKAE